MHSTGPPCPHYNATWIRYHVTGLHDTPPEQSILTPRQPITFHDSFLRYWVPGKQQPPPLNSCDLTYVQTNRTPVLSLTISF